MLIVGKDEGYMYVASIKKNNIITAIEISFFD